jgi:hypothetical protein
MHRKIYHLCNSILKLIKQLLELQGSLGVHFHLLTYYSINHANFKENFFSFAQPPFLNLQLQNKEHDQVYYVKPHL